MKTKAVRPAEQSKTIQAKRRSDRLQNIVLITGAAIAVGWQFTPENIRTKIKEQAIPAIGAASFGAAFAQRWLNRAMEDGRIDAGDLFTPPLSPGPNPGEFVENVLLGSGEAKRLGQVKSFVESGVLKPEVVRDQMRSLGIREEKTIAQSIVLADVVEGRVEKKRSPQIKIDRDELPTYLRGKKSG